jgi:FKBP-type peptidyl-prolyl cis-trans isomerase FkpA
MKKHILKTITLTAIIAVLAITSCKNSPYPGYEQSENGLYSKFYKHDEKAIKAQEGDLLQISVTFKNSKDSVLFDSKTQNRGGGDFVQIRLLKPSFKGSLEDALASMSLGDSASFLVSADSFFLVTNKEQTLPKFIEKGSMLTFEIALQKITSKAEVEKEQQKMMDEQKVMMELRKNEEPKTLAKYLEDNKIKTKPTESGLYYIEKTKGKGPKPVAGSVVKVNYTGHLLDGTIFDTSDEAAAKQAGVYDERRPYGPIEFPIGQGQVVQGWEEALLMMSAGTKVQLIVPSSLGYGERGRRPSIPPFTPMVFDMELVSFGPAEAPKQ